MLRDMSGGGLQWQRLVWLRTALLAVAGFGFLCAGAFVGLGMWAGFVSIGLSALIMEYLISSDRTGARA